jgi:energy-coupling factor transport system substrate-specific component
MLGAVMFVSKVIMEGLPNIHLLGTLVVAFTLTYRAKALFPIYMYVFANGLWEGFSLFGWLPEIYLWLILWGAVMLLPKNMPRRIAPIIYMIISGLHGLLFGVLYAPVYAIFTKIGWDRVWLWVMAGLPFDLLHGTGNLMLGILIVPLTNLLRRLDKKV